MAKVVLVTAAVLIGAALVKSSRSERTSAPTRPRLPSPPRPAVERQLGSVLPGRIASLFAAAFLFAAGAALGGAFRASADDGVQLAAATDATSTAETTTEAASPAEPALGEQAASTAVPTDPVPPPTTEEPPASEPGTTSDLPTPTATEPSSPPPSPNADDGGQAEAKPGPVAQPLPPASHRAPETTEGAAAVIWLHRTLPDPTPPARRLTAAFAAHLAATARAYGIRWSLLLAVLRVHGREGRVPASTVGLSRAARRIAAHTVSIDGEVRALNRYNRAVTLRGLVSGIEAEKLRLERRVLRDRRIDVYPAGRADVAAGRVDPRVLVVMRYLAIAFHRVEVTSLVSGHRLFARPGVISAHVDGLAVDVAALRGIPVSGHQEPGGITERAVEALLRLPAELQPQQVISLLGLGGASFAQADHYDHIHVGF